MCKRITILLAIALMAVITPLSQAVTVIADFDGSTAGTSAASIGAANLDSGTAGGSWTVNQLAGAQDAGGGRKGKVEGYSNAGSDHYLYLDGPRLDKSGGSRTTPFDYRLHLTSAVTLGTGHSLLLDACCRRSGAGDSSDRDGLIIGYDADGDTLFELRIEGKNSSNRGIIGLNGQANSTQRVNFVDPGAQPATTAMKTIKIVLGASSFDVMVGGNTAYSSISYTETVTDLSEIQFTSSGPDAGYAGYSIDTIAIGQDITPFKASNPQPQDGATWADALPDMTWEPGDKVQDVDGHLVYIDPCEAKVVARTGCLYQGEVTSLPNFSPAAELDFETTYYWAVDEVNGVTTWPGDTWSFTVRSKPVPPSMDLWLTDIEENKATINMLCLDDGNEPGQVWFQIRGDFEDDWHYIGGDLVTGDNQLVVHTFEGLLPGTTYEVAGEIGHVGGRDVKGDLFTTLGERPPLFIYRQPQGKVVRLGSQASLSVGVVSDSDSIHYQWLKTGTAASSMGVERVGGDSPVVNIPRVSESDIGSYYCIVTADGIPDVAISDTVDLEIQKLMGHWEMDGDLTDASGNGWDGAMNNPALEPTFMSNPMLNSGQSLQVRPWEKNFVVIPDSEQAFKFKNKGFTFSCWMRCRAPKANCMISKQKRAAWPWYGHMLTIDSQGMIRFSFRNGKILKGTKWVKDGAWHMVTGTYSAETMKTTLYIDGEYNASLWQDKPVPESDMPVTIGAEDVTGIATFNGELDDVRIYNYPLTHGEITTALVEAKWGPIE